MRAPAMLTGAPSTFEAHIIAELRPINWIKPAHLWLNRHLYPASPAAYSQISDRRSSADALSSSHALRLTRIAVASCAWNFDSFIEGASEEPTPQRNP